MRAHMRTHIHTSVHAAARVQAAALTSHKHTHAALTHIRARRQWCQSPPEGGDEEGDYLVAMQSHTQLFLMDVLLFSRHRFPRFFLLEPASSELLGRSTFGAAPASAQAKDNHGDGKSGGGKGQTQDLWGVCCDIRDGKNGTHRPPLLARADPCRTYA